MKKTNVCSRCGKGPKVNRSWCRECLRIYDQEYRKRNAKRLKIYRNKYQLTVYKEKKSVYDKKHKAQNKEHYREKSKQWSRQLRLDILSHYGGKCVWCGETRTEFLAMDHINGGGNIHRKSITTTIYRWLKANNYPDTFQILCHNCNASKSFYGYCPHQKEKENVN